MHMLLEAELPVLETVKVSVPFGRVNTKKQPVAEV